MAVEISSDIQSIQEDLSITDIVFSCGICQASIRDVYATKESSHGFHSGPGSSDGIVTKLWISECSHITCSKHLKGGAIPFHPKDKQPEAVCPQCEQSGDSGVKQLYGVRGTGKGEYDEQLPAAWLVCPPNALDLDVKGMDCLRFQYLTLARYGIQVTKHWHAAEQKQHAMEQAYVKERKRARTLEKAVNDRDEKLVTFDKMSAEVAKWEARRPSINHHLKTVTEMGQELQILRSTLTKLGYRVSARNYAMAADRPPDGMKPAAHQNSSTSHRGEYREGSSTLFGDHETAPSSARKKRKYAGEHVSQPQPKEPKLVQRSSSREMMPPPPALPVQRPAQLTRRQPVGSRSVKASQQHAQELSLPPPRVPLDHSRSRYSHEASISVAQEQRHSFDQAEPYHTFQPSRNKYPQVIGTCRSNGYVEHDHVEDRGAPRQWHQDEVVQRPWRRANQNEIQHSYLLPDRMEQNLYQRPRPGQNVSHAQGFDQPEGLYYSHSVDTRGESHQLPQAMFVSERDQLLSRSTQDRLIQQPAAIPRRTRDAPDASLSSPFFTRGVSALPTSSSTHSRSARHASHTDGSYNDQAHSAPSGAYQIAPSHGVFREQPLFPSTQDPQLEAYNYQPDVNLERSEPTALVENNAKYDGLFRRPDSRAAPSGRQTDTYRSKLDFFTPKILPSASPRRVQPLYSDVGSLASFRGVRGLTSQRGLPEARRNDQRLGASHPVFSSAGGRRDVRR